MRSHMWPDPQLHAISMNFYSCGSSRFCDRPTYKRWFLKIVQVTMKHDPRIHVDFTSILHSHTPSAPQVWSRLGLARNFSTNESTWSVMVISSYNPPTLTHSPHNLVRATSERFLPAGGTFRAILSSESHWLQPLLVLSVHWWPAPSGVGSVWVDHRWTIPTNMGHF